MTAETKKAEVPPYVGFSTFVSFIKGLGATGVPSRIDKSLLRNMSGSNQSALLAALKWFRLIDDVGLHGAPMESLVNAGDGMGVVLREMLPKAYKFMADGSIDLSRATGSQLEEKFRSYGISGATVVKVMSFFIAACKEAKVPISAHIKLPKAAPRPGGQKGKKSRPMDDDDDDGVTSPPSPPAAPATASQALLDKFPSFNPEWSSDLQSKWFDAFAKMQELVKDK